MPMNPEMAPSRSFSRQDWLIILALAAVNFLHVLDFVIIMPLGDRLMRELSLSPSEFGYIVSAYAIAAMLATLVASPVVDRFDRKTVLLLAFVGFTISTAFCGLSDSYTMLLLGRGLAGVFGGLCASAILAVIGDRFADARRGTATGAVMSAFAVASIAGLPAGLWLATQWGRGAPFLAIALLAVPVGFGMARFLPRMIEHTRQHRNPWADFRAAASTHQHLVSFAFMATLVFATFTIIPFLAPYLVRNAGRSEADVPIIYFVAGIITFVVLNGVGRLADRYGKRIVFRVMALGSVIMTLIMTNLPEVSLIGAIGAASGFMVFASGRMVPAQAMMIGSATPQLRGAFLNLNSAVQHLTMSIAPTVAGAIMTGSEQGPLQGYPIIGAIAAGFGLLSLVLAEWVRPALLVQAVSEPQPLPA
jgi:predicted MFS family arabinose efflux permease